MATAPRPGVDREALLRTILDSPIPVKVAGTDLPMRVGDIAGDVEEECKRDGGYAGLACIGLLEMNQIDLALLASLRFYAERQHAREVKFETVKAETTYRAMLDFVRPELPDGIGDALEVSEDPTPGA